ncbi:rap1 GTPase-activating protein 1-like isoform X3 [Diaphorina citri]|uniref:Rap1 GTPase-activating protein 1-like isoform X3 n=1 Tax=Diaphorina citri TaxID=121845 RepID=A0A3Q0IRH2_DIACI|nr:rap1 GTPase-activating protein 1-like isoform X3 [Diaphorina citri]
MFVGFLALLWQFNPVNIYCQSTKTSRDESRTSSSQHDKNNSKELLEETLRGSLPYPMIVTPPSGGYWLDGYENESRQNSNSHQHGPTAPWRSKIECDDTAKCYRRFFLGRVSHQLLFLPSTILHLSYHVFDPNICFSRARFYQRILNHESHSKPE